LPFDSAQGGESFGLAQDREPVERLVVHFGFEICNLGFIWDLRFVIWDLTNFILEKNVPLDQSEFCKLHLGHNV